MRIAFAGFRHSHILALYDKALNCDGVTITGCFEEEPEKSLKNIEHGYATYEDVLSDVNVDAIAIGDYYGKRGEMIIRALRSGKHVICDKPICTDLDELYEIKRLSRQSGLKVMCMLDLRYMPQVAKVRELIESGELGKIHIASFTGQHFLNYGNRPDWYFEKGKHGGTINDIAIHGIDLLRLITGKNLTCVNFAKTRNAFASEEPQFNDLAQFMAEMEDMQVMADVSYSAPGFGGTLPTYWDFKLWGTEGMLSFNLKESDIHIFKGTETVIPCESPLTDYLKDFIYEIYGIPTIMSACDVLESQEQVLKIQQFADNTNKENKK